MSGNVDTTDDDYVAKLLAEDAKKSSIRYASAGLSALLPKSSRNSGLKPNTRFLNHLVRDVDSHNAALKRKEEIETRSRLETFRKREREEERQRASDLARKRRRTDQGEEIEKRVTKSRRRDNPASPDRERKDDKHDRRSKRHEYRYHRSKGGGDSDDDTKHRDGLRRSKDLRDGHESKRLEPREDEPTRRVGRDKTRNYGQRTLERRTSTSSGRTSKGHSVLGRRSSRSSSSDPLEEFIGPQPNPEPQIRGRGRHSKSNMDARFSSNYDPNLDTNLSSPDSNDIKDGDDWDMALEVLRDRTAWKRKQADRMREAGFTTTEIEKWERGAMNFGENGNKDGGGDLETVKWSKKGEGREWDRGKEDLIFSDGDKESIRQPVSNGRLKDSNEGWSRKNNGFLKDFKKALG